jgi:hypothetical protein
MPGTPSLEVSQSYVTSVLGGGTPSMEVSQAFAIAIANFPTESMEVSQGFVQTIIGGADSSIEVAQSFVIAVVRGRVDDPNIRAWTFTLDGHDFYVLRLGNNETLVFDVTTEQWSRWGSGEDALWTALTGANWVGGNTFAQDYGSNVIVGCDSNGSLFFLDPNKPHDDAVLDGRDPVPFRRRVTGQIPLRGYNQARVFEVQVLGSVNDLDPGSDLSMELLYSDDRGDNYVSAGVITAVDQDFDVRASWRSLGSFSSPGRLFRVEDYGALKRIDSMTVSTSLSNEG